MKPEKRTLQQEELQHLENQEEVDQTLPEVQQEDLPVPDTVVSDTAELARKLLDYHMGLIAARNDDDVFGLMFRTFMLQSGPVWGAALVCDSQAELRIAGRFGTPKPDPLGFCGKLADALTERLLNDPTVQLLDAGDHAEDFDESIRKYLPGLTLLAIPLIPAPGEMIGMVLLYRKGEQPFETRDFKLAQQLALPTALAVRRND